MDKEQLSKKTVAELKSILADYGAELVLPDGVSPKKADLIDAVLNLPPKAEPEPRANAATFTVAQLRECARGLFGISGSTYDAATHNLSGTFTVAEMREHIQDWLKEVH